MTTEWDLAKRPTEITGPSPATVKLQWALYRQALNQGREFEELAEKYRLEAENAYADVAAMRQEGRDRARGEAARLLPKHERAIDVRTNSFKAMGDAKGDVAFYFLTMSNTYANLASMKYAKAAAIRPVT